MLRMDLGHLEKSTATLKSVEILIRPKIALEEVEQKKVSTLLPQS